MKKFYVLTLVTLGLVSIAGFVWAIIPVYKVISVIQNIYVLSSKDEVFVFVQHNSAVLRQSRILIASKIITSTTIIPTPLNENLLVAHVKNGNLSKVDLKKFGTGGSPFVYNGHIFWGRGGAKQMVWKLEKGKFISLSEKEVTTLSTGISDDGELIAKEGWVLKIFKPSFPDPDIECHLTNDIIEVMADNHYKNDTEERVIIMWHNPTVRSEEIILNPKGYKTIDNTTYEKLIKGD